MMKKNTLLLALLSVSIAVMSQNSKESGRIPSLEDSIRLSNDTYKIPQLSNPDLSNPLILPAFSFYHLASPYTTAFNNTVAWDLSLKDSIYRPHFLFSPFSGQATYIGLGNYNNIGTSLMWMPTNRLSIDGSVFLNKQYGYILLFSNQIAYGASMGLNYRFTDKMQLSIWGQYVTPVNNDPFLEASNLFMKTKVGGALIVKPTRNFRFGAGLEYQHNQKEQKWEYKSGGRVSFGF